MSHRIKKSTDEATSVVQHTLGLKHKTKTIHSKIHTK